MHRGIRHSPQMNIDFPRSEFSNSSPKKNSYSHIGRGRESELVICIIGMPFISFGEMRAY